MRTDAQRQRAVEYLNRHPEQRQKQREYAREYMRRKRAMSAGDLLRLEVYRELAAVLGETCGVCGAYPLPNRRLSIDHDHATDEIRGLLCSRCNMVLGYAKDSVAILESMIRYLSQDVYTGRMFAEVLSVSKELES